MLPRNERLKKKKDFDKAFGPGLSVATHHLVTYILPKSNTSSEELTQVGIIVAKKVNKKATTRNKIKRRIREAYKTLKQSQPELVHNAGALIFIARPAIQNLNYLEILNNVKICLKRVNKLIQKKTC